MTDPRYRAWDIIFKGLGAVGLIAAFGIGLGEYYATSNQTSVLETNKLNSDQQKLYFDKQLEYYIRATETVATIANTEDKNKRRELIRAFDVLYYGPMVMFEERSNAPYQVGEKYTNDINVEKHMVAIHQCILRNCINGDLQRESLALADTCRFALSVNWQKRVQTLTEGLDIKRRLGLKAVKED